MVKIVETYGTIIFDLEDKTKKHKAQSSWKKTAFIMIDSDICEYYSWFIQKRFNLFLNKPLRNAHVSFINDSMRDLSLNGVRNVEEIEEVWNSVQSKWNGKEIKIVLDLDVRTNGEHWWLPVHYEYRDEIQTIRDELGLSKPYFGLHLSIGYSNSKNIEHNQYIHNLIKNGFIC